MAGGQQQHAHRDDLVVLQGVAVARIDQRAQQIVPRLDLPRRHDRDQEEHHPHRRRGDLLLHRLGQVELQPAGQGRGLGGEHFGPLEADVEQLRDDRQRDRIRELAHQLDRLPLEERSDRGLDDRRDPVLDAAYGTGGEEAVDRAPQPTVDGRVAGQERRRAQGLGSACRLQGSHQLRAVAGVGAPLPAAQDRRGVLVREDQMSADGLVPSHRRLLARGPVSGVGILRVERPGAPVRQGRPPPRALRARRGPLCPSG